MPARPESRDTDPRSRMMLMLVAAGIADTRISLRKPEEAQGDGNDREARRVEATVE